MIINFAFGNSGGGGGQGGDSHILKSSSAAPVTIGDGDVYAQLVPAHPIDYGTWTDTNETGYTGTRNYEEGVTIGSIMIKNVGEYSHLNIACQPWSTGIGFYISNGEFDETPSGWEYVDSTHLIFTDWREMTGAYFYADIVDGDLYMYSEDMTKIWVYGIDENNGGNVYTGGTITPAEPANYHLYQAVSGESGMTYTEYAKTANLPTKKQLVPNFDAQGGDADKLLMVYYDQPDEAFWASRRDIVDAGIRSIDDYENRPNGSVLSKKDNWNLEWKVIEISHIEAVSALPETCKDGNIYGVANASGYGIVQAQSGTTGITWTTGVDELSGFTQVRVPYGQAGHFAFATATFDSIGLDYNGNRWVNSEITSQNDGEFSNIELYGGVVVSCSRVGDYLVVTINMATTNSWWWENMEASVIGIFPNYVNSVMSEDVYHIKFMTAADYGNITPDVHTLYFVSNSGVTTLYLGSTALGSLS